MEDIIVSNMMDFLEGRNILVDIQHGFRPHRLGKILVKPTVYDFATNLDNKTQTDVAVLDFKKTFDKVDYRLLLYKLEFYRSRGIL